MKLSVVIPIFNSEKYIRRCVDSLLEQNCADMEIILVDDGSLDGSGKICDEYAKKYNIVKVVHQKNGGEGSARNAGVQISRGEWITYVDADDYVSQDFLKKILSHLTNEFDVFIYGFVTVGKKINEKKKQLRTSKVVLNRKNTIACCFLGNSLIDGANLNARSACGKVFRRSFLKEHNIVFDEGVQIGTDMLYMLKVYGCTERVQCISDAIYYYYFYNPTSITNVYKPHMREIIESYNLAIEGWLLENREYEGLFQTYRLNDIILYLKFDFFHPNNKKNGNRERFKRIMSEGSYQQYYEQSKKLKLIRKYNLAQRITFWCAIHNWYDVCKLISFVRYRR